jgi:hypothetical protein
MEETMRRIFKWKTGWAIVVYVLLDGFATGGGMGVPIFNILFGFPVGWYLGRRLGMDVEFDRRLMHRVLKWSALSSCVTVLFMLGVWLPTASMLFDPSADLANFGIPFILYEPRASFIGWLVLMIVISPFLQFLMTLFGAYLALAIKPKVDSVK